MRLHPLTLKDPKPMLKVGSKPMIELLMERFSAQGFKSFVLSVGYLADVIINYFGDGRKWGWDIDYIYEDQPLGTCGALRELKFSESFIVINADIRVEIVYQKLLNFHSFHGKQATACLALHQQQIHFGVAQVDVTTKAGELLLIEEKPIINYPVIAGIYVLDPSVRHLIPDGPHNMPDLLAKIVKLGGVSTYQITGDWADLGTFESYTGEEL